LREADRSTTGLASFIDAIKAKLNPRQAAEDSRERKEAQDAFLRGQQNSREERIAALKAGQAADLDDLTERHAQQQREHSTGYDRERARYLRARCRRKASRRDRGAPPPGRAERRTRPKQGRPAAAGSRTLSGSRFLQPKPSRFLPEKVATPLQRVSRFVSGMAATTLKSARRRIAVPIAALRRVLRTPPSPPSSGATRIKSKFLKQAQPRRKRWRDLRPF
jgi:hypothetical protein